LQALRRLSTGRSNRTGRDHTRRLCSRPDVAASFRQLLRKHTSEQPNNCEVKGIWSFLPTISAGVV